MFDAIVRFLVRLDDAAEAVVRGAFRSRRSPWIAAGTLAVLLAGIFTWGNLTPMRNGSFVRGHGPEIYQMENGAKRWCATWKTFDSLGGRGDLSNVWTLRPDLLAKIPDGPLLIADGTFVKASGPEIYIVERKMRRWVTNWPLFLQMGGRGDLHNVTFVSNQQLATIPSGDPIR